VKNTTKIGNRAESAVVLWLEQHKHKIITRNWRTKIAEIDIISLARNTDGEVEIYFTEVKMRQNNNFGGGFAAITPAKIHKMQKGAELFLARYPKFANLQPILAAAGVDGSFTMQEFLIL
jgi:putative endonuclease